VTKKPPLKVEKAKIADVPQMHKLINHFADRGEMLARPLSEIYENIRDFFVVRKGRRLIGCAALHVMWSDLAEVKSVAVAEDQQRTGIGNELIAVCLNEARELGIETVFCFTYKPGFFGQIGFKEVNKMSLPHKVWTECLRCPKFPNCDETAMTLIFKERQEA
jgi:amino-acid N-acetyltransferase